MRSFSTFSPALRSLIRFHIAYVRTPVAAHMMGTAASAPVGRSACAAISMTRAALLDELDEFARMLAGVKAMRLPAKAARVAMRENMLIDVCCFGGEVWWVYVCITKIRGSRRNVKFM